MISIAGLAGYAERVISPSVLPLAILFGLVLAAVAVSLMAILRAKTLVRTAEARAAAGQQKCDTALEALREALNTMAAQLQEVRRQPALTVVPGPAKPGLNLSKRSQALRMNRRGDPPPKIAAALDIPLQEVDLLLKVHHIVISNIN